MQIHIAIPSVKRAELATTVFGKGAINSSLRFIEL
jgi:hypothetical protein